MNKRSVSVRLRFERCRCGCTGYIAGAMAISYWIQERKDNELFYASRGHMSTAFVDELGSYKVMANAQKACNKDAARRVSNLLGTLNVRVTDR